MNDQGSETSLKHEIQQEINAAKEHSTDHPESSRGLANIILSLGEKGNDFYDQIPGVRVVHKAETRNPNEECLMFSMHAQTGEEAQGKLRFSLRTSTPSPQYRENALILYLDDQGRMKHIGQTTDQGSVISKWGRAPVLEHPVNTVPTYYGNKVVFLIPPFSLTDELAKKREPLTREELLAHSAAI